MARGNTSVGDSYTISTDSSARAARTRSGPTRIATLDGDCSIPHGVEGSLPRQESRVGAARSLEDRVL